jgi:16S rRNA (cytidine1402-2'-O)-methyltransferase
MVTAVLTVVPTPLGNLRDITLRALDALAAASVIACEDTRRTRALLSAHEIPAPELVACDERREPQVAERLIARALAGEAVALVSDSGMPLIADPGRVLVSRALAAGCKVVVLPGPSAVETALVASGLASEGYAFLGWVPRAAGERARFLTAALAAPLPSVLFESPRRLAATLAELARLAPEHAVAVARELTKLHEEVVAGSAAEVAARGVVERGEVCLVLAAAPRAERGAPAPEALETVRELVALGLPARRASELVARLTGAPRRALYDAAAGAPRPEARPRLP